MSSADDERASEGTARELTGERRTMERATERLRERIKIKRGRGKPRCAITVAVVVNEQLVKIVVVLMGGKGEHIFYFRGY